MELELLVFFLGVLSASCAAFLVVLARKMRNGDLGPNSLAGTRNERAFRSEKDWYAVQAYCSRFISMVAVLLFTSAAVLFIQVIFSRGIPFMAAFLIFIALVSVSEFLLIYGSISSNHKA